MSVPDPDLDGVRDRRLQKSAGRRQARKRNPNAREVVVGAFAHLCHRLFVIRESGEYEYELLLKMLEQTLQPFADDPAVRRALELGIDPIRSTKRGNDLRSQLRARQLFSTDGKRRPIGVLFRIGDDWFLYLLASAGKKSVQGDNEVTTIICELLDELRPQLLVTGPVSRIVRTSQNGARVAEHLKTNRTAVVAQMVAAPMDLNDPGGQATWDMLVRLAEADYHATLRRLLTGTVFELRKDRYPRSALSLPYGYRKRVVDGKPTHEVEVDLSQMPIVRSIVELAASALSLMEIADELHARHGLLSRSTRHCDEQVPVNQVSHPDTLVRLLLEALPLYLDGIYRFSHEVTIPNLDDLYGFPVQRVSPQDNGHIVVDLPFGLPEGGWHDRALIERAIARRLTHQEPTVREDRSEIRPLASMVGWFDKQHEYRLSTEDDRYCLRRRPLDDSTDAKGRPRGFGSYDGEIIGSFRDSELHGILADALLELSAGVPSDIPCPYADAGDVESIEAEQRAARDAAATARTEATLATSEDARKHYRELAEHHQAEADQLTAELGQRQRTLAVDELRMDATQIAACISGLRMAQPFGPIELHHALRRLVRNVRIDARPRDPRATLRFEVEARTNQGVVNLGPITRTLPNHAIGCGPKDPGWAEGFAERRRALIRYVLLEEASAADRLTLMRSFPSVKRKWHEQVVDALEPLLPNRQALSALIDCPVADVRRAVLGPLLDPGVGHDLDPDLAAEICRVYRDPNFEWTKSWCPGGMDRRRTVLRFIDRYDTGDGIPFAVLRDHLQISEPEVYKLIGARADGTKYSVGTVGTHPCLEDVGGWYQDGSRKRGRERRVRVRPCPHCGERRLIQPLKVPEVPGQLLCTGCRRDPVSGLAYPDSYLLPWDGPQSTARRDGRAPTFNRYQGLFLDDGLSGTHPYEPVVPSIHAPRRRR